MTSVRRFVSVALSVLSVLFVVLASAIARAEPPTVIVTLASAPAAAPVARTTLHLTPPSGGSAYVYDGASPIGALTAKGSVQVQVGKEYKVIALRGTSTIWSSSVRAGKSELEIVWEDGSDAPMISAKTADAPPAPVPVAVALPAPKPVAIVTRPTAVALTVAAPIKHACAIPILTTAPTAPTAMSTTAFDALLALVEEKAFDSTRIEVIKTAAASSHFTVAQVSKLLEKITFDSNRLDALKAVRSKVVDPENAVLLSKLFTFTSNQTEALKLFQTPTSI